MVISRSTMTVMAKELQSGDSRNTSEFYNNCIQRINKLIKIHGYHFAYSHDVDEYVQDVVIRVWKGLHTFDDQKSEFGTWLETIARNEYYRYCSRAKKEVDLIQPLTADKGIEDDFCQINSLYRCPSAEDTYLSALTVDAIYDIIRRLPPNQRKALELCRLGNIKPAEAARILECKSSNISLWLNRAAGKIRQAMLEEEYEFEPAA